MKKFTYIFSVIVIVLTSLTARPAAALEKGFLSVFGPIVGMPLGAVSGLIRGSMVKGSQHADDLSEAMGNGFWGKAVGLPVGLVTGVVSGASTGVIKGLYDGLIIGIEDPLSAESASLDGKLLEYEPYKVFEGQKTEQVQ